MAHEIDRGALRAPALTVTDQDGDEATFHPNKDGGFVVQMRRPTTTVAVSPEDVRALLELIAEQLAR